MSVIAEVKNGEIVNQVTTKQEKSKSLNSGLDKDAFLQLLVAQMKYQDPLQPTSNTEYISQLATFSQLEEMQNLNSGMTLQRASGLVGQYVFMKTTDSSGNTTYPEGQVDYVVYENNKAFLSIGGTLYSIDDLDTVADSTYLFASRVAEAFVGEMNKLPNPDYVAQSDLQAIEDLIIVYENMTDYEREFLSKEQVDTYMKYVERYQKLAVEPIQNFMSDLEKLPAPEDVTMDHVGAIHALIRTYDRFSSYQKGLLSQETVDAYNGLLAKYNELTAA